MSQPVMTQPQQLFVSSLEADWASGICDCCDDKKQCRVTHTLHPIRADFTDPTPTLGTRLTAGHEHAADALTAHKNYYKNLIEHRQTDLFFNLSVFTETTSAVICFPLILNKFIVLNTSENKER